MLQNQLLPDVREKVGKQMTREEAAAVLTNMMENYHFSADDDDWYYGDNLDALKIAISALRSGWVRTAERLPEGEEIVVGVYKDGTLAGCENAYYIREFKEQYKCWLPLPPLPENVGLEGTKTEGET